ncbi:LysR family transcriptional regulator [Crossiella sp. SN42]|uniref:LysR family transcriptional regulator n=1 Tax=Crossiella sp. SN42 TaxID=2944808 RepID=UPI00207D4CE3|nr:LysR family transcriptional regulator [Crossiella sp. SN42]MCO1580919.1 LysR family transcriptional regulator [Crossiella sp. SN42]
MDADRLRVLVEVAHAGSISAAATRLSVTPSALSQQLAKLERSVGVRLLDRGPGGVRPTEAGAVLVRHGERVLGELRDAEDAVRALLGQRPERIALGTFATAGALLVPAVLAEFRQRHPTVRLALLDIEPPAGYGLIASRELDLLITHRYTGVTLPPLGGARRHRLLTDPLRLVLPAGHRLATAERITLAELAGEEWISGSPGVPNRTCLQALAARTRLDLHVAFETRDYGVTLGLLSAGVGVSLVPASVLGAADTRRLAVRSLTGLAPVREMHVVHRARPLPLTAEVVRLLTAAGAKMYRQTTGGSGDHDRS